MAWLLGLLLVVQLAGASAHPAPQGGEAERAALATLGAALGQPVALCTHGDPNAPSTPGACDHCVLCHGTPVALPPSSPRALAPRRVSQVGFPVAVSRAGPARFPSGFSPRGPPRSS